MWATGAPRAHIPINNLTRPLTNHDIKHSQKALRCGKTRGQDTEAWRWGCWGGRVPAWGHGARAELASQSTLKAAEEGRGSRELWSVISQASWPSGSEFKKGGVRSQEQSWAPCPCRAEDQDPSKLPIKDQIGSAPDRALPKGRLATTTWRLEAHQALRCSEP